MFIIQSKLKWVGHVIQTTKKNIYSCVPRSMTEWEMLIRHKDRLKTAIVLLWVHLFIHWSMLLQNTTTPSRLKERKKNISSIWKYFGRKRKTDRSRQLIYLIAFLPILSAHLEAIFGFFLKISSDTWIKTDKRCLALTHLN